MGVVTFEGQNEGSSVPPAKLFKMMVLEAERYIPKVVPGLFKGLDNLQGEGGSGTVRHVNFSEGYQFSHLKQTLDGIDEENFIFDYSIVGGDPAFIDTTKVEKMSFQVKFETSPNGRNISKRSCKAYTVDGVEVNEDEIRAFLEKTNQTFFETVKIYEAYALANPDDV
ncbi:hypothetical protein JCGZ_02802 [Jatropha curcas]|uniref:Bet v I/Major latex protein domain-containing protein n=1 Tax=Jatropha curcas TaxID=180498 RepID=A0A067LE25_JATCU|nr:major allergen Pru ar 1 [Jatropha curcas]KDP42329.1 hypothetical protein JCGZ_02802 [Jatropha curcas]